MKEESKVPEIINKETSRRGFLKGAAVTAGGAIALATIGGVKPREVKAAEAPKAIQRYLFVERQNCTGCRACEYACNIKHEGVVRPSTARIHVLKHKGVVDVPVICWHCDDHPCVAACPTNPKSLTVDPKSNGLIVNDIVYEPLQTRLLTEAKKAGARTVTGLGMLIHQAALSFEIWTGRRAPIKVMTAAAKRELRRREMA